MCLLIALFQVTPDAPLVIGANRDEQYQRPAVALTVLRESAPRTLGGRDELAGGTWLAVNEHGVVAGLTNQPVAARDPAKRSRGELPLAFTRYRTAARAVRELAPTLDPAAYNPSWLLVGDRESLFSVGLASGREPLIEQLPPGLHVLQNTPLHATSPKTSRIESLVARELPSGTPPTGDQAAEALAAVLRDHVPAQTAPVTGPGGRALPPELSAACVHTSGYGTRSSMIITVPAAGLPQLRLADGPPCQAPRQDVTTRWATVPAA
jgi:uncharacterized protein with NRDE domain